METPPIQFNLNADIVCKSLAELGIWHESEWIAAENLWALFFKDHKGETHGFAFRIFGFFSPLLMVSSGKEDIDKRYYSASDIVALVKNTYCKEIK